MFDPKLFASTARRESIVVGNSAHPVGELLTSMLARPVPSLKSLWYMRTKADTVAVTYRPADRSLCFFEMSFEEFKDTVDNGTILGTEVYEVPEGSKWIGTMVNTVLRDVYELS